jgi:PPE-repeat protein
MLLPSKPPRRVYRPEGVRSTHELTCIRRCPKSMTVSFATTQPERMQARPALTPSQLCELRGSTAMDYGILPPEINSARIYAGPGSAPMLAAASAWDSLAGELGSAATSYTTVISELTEEYWRGSASSAMAAAATQYVTWMNSVAAQAEQTAGQAQSAAAAFDAAFAMTVPPAVVAANRAQLAALVATNVLGQNTSAIAVTEALYGEMWAQDAAAMYGYAGSSAAAATVTPFSSPPDTTNPAAAASQAGAVGQATGATSSAGVQSTLSQVVTAMPAALQSLATPVDSTPPIPILSQIGSVFGLGPGDITNLISNLASSSFTPMAVAGFTQVGADSSVIRALNTVPIPGDAPGIAGGGIAAIGAVGPAAAPANIGSAPVSASIGQATLVAKMSVPQSWTAATPAASPPAGSLPAAAEGWAIAPDAGMAEMAPPAGMPGMPGVPGGGLGNRGYGFAAPRYGFKPVVVTRPPAAG